MPDAAKPLGMTKKSHAPDEEGHAPDEEGHAPDEEGHAPVIPRPKAVGHDEERPRTRHPQAEGRGDL
jgi:hypothetical protein